MNVSDYIRFAVIASAAFLELGAFAAAPITARSSSTVELGYVGSGDISRGTVRLGEIDTMSTRVRHVESFPVNRRFSWRVGGEWERLGFGVPVGSPIPNTLQSLNLHLGGSMAFSEKIAMQFEVDPGIYSDFEDIDFGDLNAPISTRLFYVQNPNVQWVMALISNPKSELPFVGGVGLRWRFAPDWTIDLILPRPQVRYEFSDMLSFHAGGEFRGGAYRVAENFGTRTGRPELDDDDVTYREVRVGAGFRWKFNKSVSAVVDGGWVIDRRFTYENARLQLNGDGAPFLQFAIRARF
jgi:hypothetical protein